jgi:benzil reductase ((S)-benzoin forming)
MNLYIVTGTTKGLGVAIIDVIATDKNNLVLTLSRASSSFVSDNAPANVYLDAGKPDTVEAAFVEITKHIAKKKFHRAVLINNAGVLEPVARFDEISADLLSYHFNVNVVTPMLLTQCFANALRAQSDTRLVINISSGAAKRAIAGWSAYCTAKAALEMATRVAALEAATNDATLSVCSLAPGVVDTPMQTQIRGVAEHHFPDVARFKAMKAEGALRDAPSVAKDIVGLIDGGRLTNGGNFDIRDLLPAA